MGLQDFTDDWVEVDPDEELTVTSTKIHVSTADYDDSAKVYKDYGADFFSGDFTHKFELTVTEIAYGILGLWAISNVTTGTNDFADDDIFLSTNYPNIDGDYCLYLRRHNPTEFEESNDLDYLTKYYITVNRTGSVYTVTIRTGSHTGAVIDIITIDDSTTISRRYLYSYVEGWG